MTDGFFEQLYDKYRDDVQQAARRWKRWLRNKPGYNYLDVEDLEQEIWLEIWLMPDGLPDLYYLDAGFRHATALCNAAQVWYGEWRGKLVAEIPSPGYVVEHPTASIRDKFVDQILNETELRRRLSEGDWVLYNRYFKYNLGKHPLEKRGRSSALRFKHYEGWTDEEIAKLEGVHRNTVVTAKQRIRDTIKEILAENGDKESINP